MLKDIIPKWAEITFEQALNIIPYESKIKEELRNTDLFFSLKERYINGGSVEHIKNINEYKIPFSMTKIFHQSVAESIDDLPIRYLLNIVSNLVQLYGMNSPKLSGILGRCYRSFPSFIRDYDVKERLELLLKSNYRIHNNQPYIKMEQNPDLDIEKHADIALSYETNGKKMYIFIWLYQYTIRSLINLKKRLSGSRGNLPNGIHLLVPLKTDLLRTSSDLQIAINHSQVSLEQYKKLSKKKDDPLLSSKIMVENIKFEQLISDYVDFENRNKEDLQLMNEINGWMLYSDNYIAQISEDINNIINSEKDFMNYYEMMNFIGENSSFLSKKICFIKK